MEIHTLKLLFSQISRLDEGDNDVSMAMGMDFTGFVILKDLFYNNFTS